MQAAKVHTSTGCYSCRLVSSRLSSNQGSVLVYGHVSASGDAAGAASVSYTHLTLPTIYSV